MNAKLLEQGGDLLALFGKALITAAIERITQLF
jgi:hypothetical protein